MEIVVSVLSLNILMAQMIPFFSSQIINIRVFILETHLNVIITQIQNIKEGN